MASNTIGKRRFPHILDISDDVLKSVAKGIVCAKGFATVCKRFRCLALAHISHISIIPSTPSEHAFPSTLLPSLPKLSSLTSISLTIHLDTLSNIHSFTTVLSQLPDLLALRLSSPEFHPLAPELVCSSIQRCTLLHTLDLSGNQMSDNQLWPPPLAIALHHLTNLHTLNLHGTNIQNSGSVFLSWVISRLTSLQHLDISWCKFNAPSTTNILQGLTSLTRLDMAHCNLDTLAARSLSSWLSCLPSLRHLNIGFNHTLSDGDTISVAAAVRHAPLLQHLNLDHIELDDWAATALAASLRRLPCLEYLKIFVDSVQNAGAPALAASFEHLTALRRLDLSCGHHDNCHGVKAVAGALRYLKSLQILELNDNICSRSFATLAYSLRHLPTIQYINLCSSSISHASAFAFTVALRQNTALKFLDLSNTDFGLAAPELARTLHKLPCLQALNLCSCKIAGKGMALVVESLKSNPSLNLVCLSHNVVGDNVARSFSRSLRQLPALKNLYLECCKIGSVGAEALAGVLLGLKSLECVNVMHNAGFVESSGNSEDMKALLRKPEVYFEDTTREIGEFENDEERFETCFMHSIAASQIWAKSQDQIPRQLLDFS